MNIVEIGAGKIPVFGYSQRVKRLVNDGALYIGIDINPERAAFLHRYRHSYVPEKSRIYPLERLINPVVGALARIPLKDNIADEVWVLNTMGDEAETTPNPTPNGHHPSPQFKEMDYFAEIARVLRPGGKAYVGEWGTRVVLRALLEADYKQFGLLKDISSAESARMFMESHGIGEGVTKPSNPPVFMTLTKTGLLNQ